MFKNLLIYRIAPGWEPELSVAEQALQAQHFSPCSPTQEQSSGWVPPRGHDHGPLIESIDSQWIMRWRTETKVLPADAVERKIDEKCAAIEAQTGRKPGRGERRDIKDEVRRSLLPNALTKQQGAWVWIAPKDRLLAIDVASPARADAILTALVDQLPGFVPRRIQTAQAPASAMAAWLDDQDAPSQFCLGDACALQSKDESRAKVRYDSHALEIEEIRGHLQAGKRPTSLALGFGSSSGEGISFTLTDALHIKRLSIHPSIKNSQLEKRSEQEGVFDADVAITTGELRQLIAQLIDALGGEPEESPN